MTVTGLQRMRSQGAGNWTDDEAAAILVAMKQLKRGDQAGAKATLTRIGLADKYQPTAASSGGNASGYTKAVRRIIEGPINSSGGGLPSEKVEPETVTMIYSKDKPADYSKMLASHYSGRWPRLRAFLKRSFEGEVSEAVLDELFTKCPAGTNEDVTEAEWEKTYYGLLKK